MKKLLKILLIVFLCFVVAYGIKIVIGLWIWHNISSEDQMKIVNSVYEKCKAKGGDNCEAILAKNLQKVMKTQRIEYLEIVLDKTKSDEERLMALNMFYTMSGEDHLIDKEEADFYYSIASDKENPFELRQTAISCLLESKTDDPEVMEFQMMMAKDPDVRSDFRIKAIKSLGGSGAKESDDILMGILKDEDSTSRYEAGQSLVQIGAIEKIPELVKIALDEAKNLTSRSIAMSTIKDMAVKYNIKDPEIVEKLEPLLNNQEYTVRAAAAMALEALTGKEYKVEGTDEDIDEYITNTYLEDILVPGIDF